MTALSDAIARAHIERAKARGRDYAKRLNRVIYIYPTRHGLELDIQAPMVADYFWTVDPDGTIAQIKRKGF